ncbi:unnamed protein product, partial [Ectocarpus fasciculatus]
RQRHHTKSTVKDAPSPAVSTSARSSRRRPSGRVAPNKMAPQAVRRAPAAPPAAATEREPTASVRTATATRRGCPATRRPHDRSSTRTRSAELLRRRPLPSDRASVAATAASSRRPASAPSRRREGGAAAVAAEATAVVHPACNRWRTSTAT